MDFTPSNLRYLYSVGIYFGDVNESDQVEGNIDPCRERELRAKSSAATWCR